MKERPYTTPYHPREFGRETDSQSELPPDHGTVIHTGLLGVGMLFLIACATIFLVVVWAPLVLIGVAEVVSDAPNVWRGRLIRRKP